MASVTFGGLITGLDSNSIIDNLVKAEKQAGQPLQTQQTQYTTRKSVLTDLTTRLVSLRGIAGGLGIPSLIRSVSGTSSDASRVTVGVAGAAVAGTHSLVVNQLAQAGVYQSSTFASDTDGIAGTGSLTLTAGSAAPVTVSFDNNDSLTDIAGKINSASSRVAASVLYDGTSYRLLVQARDSGAANAITFAEAGSALGFTDPGANVVTAQDASFTFDNIGITRATNVFSDVLPGVTLSLVSRTPNGGAATTISITNDRAGTVAKVQKLVDAYNGVASLLGDQLSYSGTVKGPDTLFGDAGATGLQRQMGNIVTQSYSYAGGSYMPRELGITLLKDGTLQLDTAKLNAVLQTDPQAVERLLLGSGSDGLVSAITNVVKQYTDPVSGVLTSERNTITTTLKGLADRLQAIDDRATRLGDVLRTQFAAMEQMVSAWKNQAGYLANLGSGTSVSSK